MLLQGKVVVVFGGSGAIGSAVARTMAREGARVHLVARRQAQLDRVADDLRAAGRSAETLAVDVLDEQATCDGMAQLSQRTGGIDVVVNATGFMHDQGKSIFDLSLAEFRQGYDPFLSALFILSKAVAPHMGGERPGTILMLRRVRW